MPSELTRRAAALAAGDGSWLVPEAAPAATVVLLRETPAGISTYLMRRTTTMAFAAGMHVFPGGRIDAQDYDGEIGIRGPIDAVRMNADEPSARALIVGAIREVFEETGVLLAVDEQGDWPIIDDTWDADRNAVDADSAQFAHVLQRRGLHIDTSLLPLWGHWITPEVETRRYDVRFYAAVVPAHHPVRDVSGEADHVRWITPTEGLAAYARGELAMLPPTVATLRELSELTSVGDLASHAQQRIVQPLLPRPRLSEAGEVVWEVINATTGDVVWSMGDPPAGSESLGVHA